MFSQGSFNIEELKPIVYKKEAEENIPIEITLGFDPSNIISGPPIYLRKQVYYQAHVVPTYSLSQALLIIKYLGEKFDSTDVLPYAIKIIENGQSVNVCNDNGEFACGDILLKSLKRLENFNTLICVTRKVRGCFVVEMLQTQKLHYIKEAADRAIEQLFQQLKGNSKQ